MKLAKPGLGRLVRADLVISQLTKLPDAEARAVVESLPAEDLLLLTRRSKQSDALMLVEYASNDQISRMIDLDAWRGDQLDLARFFEWSATLNEISQEKAVSFLSEVDAEYPALVILKAGRVVDRRDVDEGDAPFDEDTEDAVPSPDNQFMIIVPKDDPLLGPLRTLLDYLYAGDIDHARMVLQAARWELSASVEEELLHFREGRLEEMGIPDTESSWKLFKALPRKAEERLLARTTLADSGVAAERLTDVLLVPLELHADRVLEAAVEALTDDERLRFAQGAIHAAHKIALVRGDDVLDPTAMASAMRILADHLRLALDVLSDRADADRWIATVHPEYLFRVAHTRLLALKTKAQTLLRPLGGEAATVRFDSPWRDVLEHLLQRLPELARPGLLRLETRAFCTRNDLVEAEGLLSVIANQASFFALLLDSAPGAPASASFATLFATGFANQLLGRGWTYAPLPASDLPALGAAAVVVADGKTNIRADVRARLLEDFEALVRVSFPDRADDRDLLRDLTSMASRTLDSLAGALGAGGRHVGESAGVAAEALLIEGEDEA